MRAITRSIVVDAKSTDAPVKLFVEIVTVFAAETYALRTRPASETPADIPRTISPKTTPGTVIVSVAAPAAPVATEAESRVAVTDHVSENIPLNWSVPLRDTTAVALAIIISPN
jgi:hypothetical protein